MAQTTQNVKLCPHCANSIAHDAVSCPYCKAELGAAPAPEWAERSRDPVEAGPVQSEHESKVKSKIIVLVVALILAATAAFWLVPWQRGERLTSAMDQTWEIREKDQKIQTLETELAKLREANQGSSGQFDEIKAKLIESQKDLAALERRLADANREIDRLTSSRGTAPPGSAARSADPLPAPARPAPFPARSAAAPGVYETLRSTTVFEDPVGSSRVLTQIPKGTRVTVVRSAGEWLEVRSKHGKPPGFIQRDDAMFISRAN